MNIQEGNKLIAEFMGLNEAEDEYPKGLPSHVELWGNFMDNGDKIQYHSSWDWLMPVVEKIIKMDFKANDYDAPDYTYLRTFGMIDEESRMIMVRFNRMGLFMSSTLIEATYNAVIGFITWYNTAKNKEGRG